MKVIVDAWAWVRKADLTLTQLDAIHAKMVVTPQRYGAPEEEEESIPLYTETPEWIGIAREYFLARRRPDHDVEIRASPGAAWPEPLQWNPQFTLRDEQERAVTELGARFRGGTMGGLLRAKPGWGKCCTSNTYITDGETGVRKRIAEWVGEMPSVPSLDAHGKIVFQRAARVWASGVKPCLRLTLASGQWFEGSEDHPVLTPTGYRPLGELGLGELVATARVTPAPRTGPGISEDEVLVAAALLADGALAGGTTTYVKGDVELVRAVKESATKVPGFEGFGREVFEKGAHYVTLCGLVPWTTHWGLRGRSKEKRVPPAFFGLPDPLLALFLRWIYTDGNVYTGSPRKIELVLASEGFIDDVQELLRRFGVVARKSYKPKSIRQGDGTKKVYPAWRLQIADAPNQLRFLGAVGMIPGKIAACLALRAQALAAQTNPNWDVVPVDRAALRRIQAEDTTGVWAQPGGLGDESYMGRERFRRLCEASNYAGSYRRHADEELVWERVRTIEPLGVQPVYDLTVPETHNAIANGLVIHNTIAALALVQRMGVPALIVVHKEFLAEQWMERIHGNPKKGLAPTLPNARVGLAQEDTCDFEGKHLVIGMVQSLSKRDYPAAFFRWPGIVITDECHRIGARSWSKVPPRFLSRWRFGITATPRRKDGCERIFLDHIGPILFTGTEERLPFAVRRVWTQYVPPKSAHINAGLAGRAILLDHIVGDAQRNRVILGQLVQAVVTGRKVLVLSERLEHLARLERMLRDLWPADRGKAPSSAQYVGGMTSEERTIAEEKQVIFATLQYVAEGLDIPALDTAFLTTPMTDVEQAIGRIQRPHPGKRPPVVVDFRDDGIPTCARAAKARDRYYAANSAKT